MGKSVAIKNALLQILGGIEVDGESVFVAVTDQTTQDFDGYPILRLLPGYIENVKGAQAEMDRSVNFNAVVHLPVEINGGVKSEIIDQIYDITDLIIDRLDQADEDNELTDIDPTIREYIMSADRGEWELVDGSGSVMLMLVVTITVSYSKQL